MSLADKTRELIVARTKLETVNGEHKKTIAPLEVTIAALAEEIKTEMKANHLSSFRTEYGTPYISIRKTLHVEDETKVIAWLKNKKTVQGYISPRLTEKFYEDYLHGEAKGFVDIDGVAVKEVESFGVRKPENNHETNKQNN